MISGPWHSVQDDLSATVTLADGYRVLTGPSGDTETPDTGSWEVSVGPDGQLLILLRDVPATCVDGMPDIEDLAPMIIRDDLVPVCQAQYAWDLQVRTDDHLFESTGFVSAELVLTATVAHASVPTDKQSEIETALQRGLLDEHLHHVAEFRLRMRAVRDQLLAIRQSGFIPGWRQNVLFATFQDKARGDWTDRPLAGNRSLLFDFRFTPRERQQGFRMTDLFQRG